MRITNYKLQITNGFSLVEVILAVAIFSILAVSGISTVLHGLSASRLGEEESNADFYAQEGIEAVKSIKNRAFGNLVAGTYGLATAGNQWNFSGTSDTQSKYTRQVVISAVSRDVSGNIVDSGGTPDPDTMKATANVTWDFSEARTGNQVSYITYLTNFRKAIATLGNGLLLYSDTVTTPTFPKYRIYTDSTATFSSQTDIIAGGAAGRLFKVRTSPTKREAVAGYIYTSGSTAILQVMCFDGTVWSNDWNIQVNNAATVTTRRFDIAYETYSGNVLVLYSTNAGTNELSYRTKPGTANCGAGEWSAPTTFDSPGTTGVVQWVKMAWDRRTSSNLIAAIWADTNLDLQGAMWNGTAWIQRTAAMETSLEVVGTSTTPNVDDFDVEFESTSGDVLVVWANSAGTNGTNGVRYMTCPGGAATCTWSGVLTPPTFADDAQNLDISANPNDNQIIFASIGAAGADLQVGRWDGAAWVNVPNKDPTARVPIAGSQKVATGWTISGTTVRGIVVYHNAVTTGIISYLTMTPGATPTWSATLTASPVPTMGTLQNWYDIQMDPVNKDTLVLTASNSVLDLFAKRLVMNATPTFTWTDANAGAVLEINLSQAIVGPFEFAYWRNP